MVDKIKHIFLVLILPTKSVFKNYAVYNIHRLAWGSFAFGTTIVPIHKTALRTVTDNVHFDILKYVYLGQYYAISK